VLTPVYNSQESSRFQARISCMTGGYSQDRTLSPPRVVSAPVTPDLPPKPAPLSSAVPIFAATSLLFFVSLYVGLPYLRHEGVSWFWTYNLVLALPMFALVLFALLAYRSAKGGSCWPKPPAGLVPIALKES